MLQPRQPRWRQQQLRTHTHHPHEAYSGSSEHTHSSSCSLPPVHFPIIRQFLQRGSGVGDGRGCWEEWGYCSWVDRGGLEGGGMARSFSFLSLGCFFFLLVSSSFLFFFSPSFSCGDQHPLANAASNWERSKAEKASAGQARLTGVTLTAASMCKGSVVAAKERACTVSLSPTLSFSHTHPLLLSLTPSFSPCLPHTLCSVLRYLGELKALRPF